MSELERRKFLKAAAAAAAFGSVPTTLGAADFSGATLAPTEGPIVLPLQEAMLGNGEAPALQFQAYPGGTGALLDKLWREHGAAAFDHHPIEIPRWSGPVPTSEEDVAFLTVGELAALVRDRHIAPTELFNIYMGRLKRLDPILHCAVTVMQGRGREEAEQADAEIAAGEWRGPLHGIPYGVKDLFSARGARTTWGSADFQSREIDEDAEIVRRLREAGAVLIAKLATGEFARGDRWYRGRTRNPWNVEEGSSGSSAGPGSATAAACVAFSIGTETQGSIVSPARRNGISALRPTFGRVSRHGGMVLAWSMDKAGPMCRSIEGCALVFNAIHGADSKDPATLTTPFRFERDPDLSAIRVGFTSDAPEAFVDALRSMGANLVPLEDPPDGGSNALGVEASAAFDSHVAPGGVLPSIPEGLPEAERRARSRFRGGRDVLALDYVQSQRRRLLLMHDMSERLAGVDMYVSGSGEVRLTNQTGHPAAIVQYGFGPRDPDDDQSRPQPLTTTLIGDLFADDKILAVAHAYQQRFDWHRRRPDLG